jgi:hypothetical protein
LILREREAEHNNSQTEQNSLHRHIRIKWRKCDELRKRRNEVCLSASLCHLRLLPARERARRGTTGMSHFHRELLQQSEHEHQATVAATSTTKGRRTLRWSIYEFSDPSNMRLCRMLCLQQWRRWTVKISSSMRTTRSWKGESCGAEPRWRQHSKLAGRSNGFGPSHSGRLMVCFSFR